MSIPAGLVTLRFCLSAYPLSSNARLAFAGGDGLPSGFGVKPASAAVWCKPPGEATKSTTAHEDAAGLYHAEVSATAEGEWQWEGQGLDSEGTLIGSTGLLTFTVGPALKA